MKIWLITDTHFGHDKMEQYCGRPQGFEDIIFNNLAQNISADDLVIHLGDFCIGNDEHWHKRFMFYMPTCWLIKGNHEHKSNSWYMKNGWDFVAENFEDVYFGKRIMFSHTPHKSTGFDLNVHGHFHNTLHRLQEGKFISDEEKERNKVDLLNLTPRHKLLAIEYTDYKPVLLEDFIK